MKRYYVYSFKHRDADFFLKPSLSEVPPEVAAEDTRRSALMHAPEYAKNGVQNCSFCLLGSVDDVTGLLEPDLRVLIDSDLMLKFVQKGLGGISFDGYPENN